MPLSMELAYLRNILSDLQKRFEQKFSSDSFYLKRELLLLAQYDKLLIKKKVLGETELLLSWIF